MSVGAPLYIVAMVTVGVVMRRVELSRMNATRWVPVRSWVVARMGVTSCAEMVDGVGFGVTVGVGAGLAQAASTPSKPRSANQRGLVD